MILMIDNYDSFVYNLVRYFKELGEEILIYRNDKVTIDEIKKMDIEGIVISPGPKAPKDAGIVLDIINEFKGKIPIFGVCLGHQSIGYAFRGKIVKGKTPMHGKISKVKNNGCGIFKEMPSEFNVTRYHSLIVERESLPKELEITCETLDGVIMGIRHRKYKIYGVQYHPEAVLTEYGYEIIENFIKICRGEIDGF